MNTIISKRPTTFIYQQYEFANGQFRPIGNGVLINGGAGVVGGAELLSGRPLEKRGLYVPDGVTTEVSDEVLEYLRGCKKFVKDEKRGMILVVKGQRVSQDDANELAKSDMISNDEISHRPYTAEDIEAAGGTINRDGSVDISDAAEDLDLVRRKNAGQMSYVKKRNLEEVKAKKRGRTRKSK